MPALNIFIDGSWLFRQCAADASLANATDRPGHPFRLDFGLQPAWEAGRQCLYRVVQRDGVGRDLAAAAPAVGQRREAGLRRRARCVHCPLAIGFGGDFWVTKTASERMTNEAVLVARAKICVGQFTDAPNYQERLKAFSALDYSAKGAFIDKGGWARMPGEKEANDAVKQSCSSALDALVQK